jgi:hypothetical protein
MPLGRFKSHRGQLRRPILRGLSIYRRFVAQVEHPGENSYVCSMSSACRGGDRHDLVIFTVQAQRFETGRA